MPNQVSQPTITEIAERLCCSPRTVNRLKRRGINPLDPVQVAEHLASIHAPSPKMIEAALSHLPTSNDK